MQVEDTLEEIDWRTRHARNTDIRKTQKYERSAPDMGCKALWNTAKHATADDGFSTVSVVREEGLSSCCILHILRTRDGQDTADGKHYLHDAALALVAAGP